MDLAIVNSRLLYRVHLYKVNSCLNFLKMSCLENFQSFRFDEISFFLNELVFDNKYFNSYFLFFLLAIRITFREIKQHDRCIDEKKGEAWWSENGGERSHARYFERLGCWIIDSGMLITWTSHGL